MANLRDIRRRIKSVKNTAQITKAMQMVAAAKMKKAQEQAVSGRPYADLINDVLVNLNAETDEENHPLLESREGDRELVIVITTDKGLCGPLNTNLIRLLNEETGDQAEFVSVGVKGRQTLARLKKSLVADFHVKDPVSFAETRVVSKFAMERFLLNETDKVKVAFTNYVNTIKQEPVIETLLPISPIDLGAEKDYTLSTHDTAKEKAEAKEDPPRAGYLFEPSASAVLDVIVPQYVNYLVYQMVLESRASEHSSRMVAMKNATDNANQIVKSLTLEYNKARQAAITNELLEITTAMRALE